MPCADRGLWVCLTVLLLLGIPSKASFSVTLDFTHDDSSSNPFFSGGTEGAARRAALQAAVADINTLLTPSTLTDITTDPITGVNGVTTATFNPNVSYTNPDLQTTTAVNILDLTTLGEGEVRVFVGSRDLSTGGGLGSDSTLAQGGRAGTGFSISGSGFESEWIGAVAAAEAAFNTEIGRGGPIMDNYTGGVTFGSTTANYDLDFGITVGHLWFDSDTNNDQTTDLESTINGFWHSDHTTDVASGEYDVYTVGLHEILHAIGFANSNEAFSGNVTGGDDWTGAEVVGLIGGGDNDALHPSSTSHINGTLTSTVRPGGDAQAPVMRPTIGSGSGSRRFLTDLDAAFLADMGFSLSAVPEVSGTLIMIPLLGTAACFQRRRRRSVLSLG